MRRSRLLRLLRLSPEDAARLLRAQAMLLRARLLLLVRRPGRLLEARGASSVARGGPAAGPAALRRARGLAADVERAARGGLFRPTCLVRALALHQLLEGSRVRGSRIRIGVRWSGREFEAHAWVELGGVVLGDRPANVDAYAALGDARLSPP